MVCWFGTNYSTSPAHMICATQIGRELDAAALYKLLRGPARWVALTSKQPGARAAWREAQDAVSA